MPREAGGSVGSDADFFAGPLTFQSDEEADAGGEGRLEGNHLIGELVGGFSYSGGLSFGGNSRRTPRGVSRTLLRYG